MNDPIIHGVVAAQFGDLEFDVGKSVRWTQWYCDHVHATDINLGTQRYWVVNWDKTFPQVKHTTTGINFFVRPTDFRKEQWRLYQTAFKVEPTDWVLWVDAHEGVSFDINSLPNDYNASPFRSWVYREVTRAETASKDRVVVPFYAFVRSAQLQNVVILDTGSPEHDVKDFAQTVSVPYYLAAQGLPRLFKASVLLDPDFDWTSLDRLTPPDPGVKMQLISYAYAHWQYLDMDEEGVVPPISETNDYGFMMRKQISMVRPLPEFLHSVWNPKDDQLVGLPGPWCTDMMQVTNPDFESSVVEQTPHTPADPTMAGLMTPLYDQVFRLNLRDGVWYVAEASGNIPMSWNSATGQWVTNYDPALWPSQGVESWAGAPPP